MLRCQSVCYQIYMLPRCPITKTSVTKMSYYRNVLLPKCHVTEMSCYRNVMLPKCPVTEMSVTKTSITKVSFTEMSGYCYITSHFTVNCVFLHMNVYTLFLRIW